MNQKTLTKLFAAVLGVGAFAFVPTAHAGPIEDARVDVIDAHAQLDAAEAHLRDVAAAQAQTQADLNGARQRVADLANAANAEGQNAAAARAHADAVRATVPGLQDGLRYSIAQAAGVADAQRRIDADRATLDGIRNSVRGEFEGGYQFRNAQADFEGARASADAATNFAVHRATETRDYHHAYDEQEELTRRLADLEGRPFVDRREVDETRDRLNAATNRCHELIARIVESDPAVLAARAGLGVAQSRLDRLHVEFEQRLAARSDYAAASADLANASAAAAGNAQFLQAQQATAQAALDHAVADAAAADDAARVAQDRAAGLASQFQGARADIAALETRNAHIGADLDAARANRDQAAALLQNREEVFAGLTEPAVGVDVGGVAVGIQLPGIIIGGEHHDRDWERRHEAERDAEARRAEERRIAERHDDHHDPHDRGDDRDRR